MSSEGNQFKEGDKVYFRLDKNADVIMEIVKVTGVQVQCVYWNSAKQEIVVTAFWDHRWFEKAH